ncbi:hypothetical protein [Actinoplanes rectilineatus]|uniref:hypothetical protein n=1 Tax=Actinoplanes rectilineatus TaxID=113571 RepID=UPI0005F2F2BE|nr:hypothetical protein [Actinoplanes rectilineatus]
MRGAILAAVVGGMLLSAGCAADTSEVAAPAPTWATPAATVATPDYSADTEQVCGRLDKVFTTALGDFGTQMGKMIAHKEAKDTDQAEKAEKAAAAELKTVGSQIRKETAAAQNPDLKQAGVTSADKFENSAKDREYIAAIKTAKDLDRTLKTQLEEWLSPVAGYCG